jgi:hypothetical protein
LGLDSHRVADEIDAGERDSRVHSRSRPGREEVTTYRREFDHMAMKAARFRPGSREVMEYSVIEDTYSRRTLRVSCLS